MSIFKDFIPEGDKKGAQGDGFRDYVPAEDPKPVAPRKEVVEKVEFDDKDLEELGIDKEKLEKYKEDLKKV